MTRSIAILCAGASQGLVTGMTEVLRAELDVQTVGRFGAVGAMREAFIAGEPCDLMILTDAMMRAMAAEQHMVAATLTPLGTVRTGVAVPAGSALPAVNSAAALAAAVRAASSIWIPDTVRSTAGIHLRKVLETLGLFEGLGARLREFPNGATAMRAMADSGDAAALGFTQVSEILFTQGVSLVGPLPAEFELGTVYTAAVSARAAQPELAGQIISRMASAGAAGLRQRCGFESI